MDAKRSCSNDLDFWNGMSPGMGSQRGAGSRRLRRGQESLLSAKRFWKWAISLCCMWRKAICKCLSANVRPGRALLSLHFHISPTPSCLCPGHPNPGQVTIRTYLWAPEPPGGLWNEFISPQWDANDWHYNNNTRCHNHLCILKKEDVRRLAFFLGVVSHLKGLSKWMHEKVWKHKHILS